MGFWFVSEPSPHVLTSHSLVIVLLPSLLKLVTPLLLLIFLSLLFYMSYLKFKKILMKSLSIVL